MLGTLLTLLVLGILAIAAVGVVLAIVGTVVGVTVGLVTFLLFKVAPVLLVGWVVLKLLERSRKRHRLAPGDQRWLDR